MPLAGPSTRHVTAARLLRVFATLVLTPAALAADTHVTEKITTNTTWTLAGSPYIVHDTVLVDSGVTLTIEPGVVVKMSGQFAQLVIWTGATLNAIGTAGSRIVFTSVQDDSIAGDSGGDGPSTGAPGQWYRLGVNGTAVLRYVDVRYGGYGSSNEVYAGVNVTSGGTADLDYCALYLNQRSGITVGANSSATISHSQLAQNAVGASGFNAALRIQANSSLSANSHTGLFLNVTDSYAGVPASLVNSDVVDNGEYGVRLMMNSTLPAAAAPFGHENNIFDNKFGAPQRQLFILWPLLHASWTDNYWGPLVDPIPCPWAPPQTTGWHLSPTPQLSYCLEPPDGPTKNAIYMIAGCPNNKPMKCRSDWVTNLPFAAGPFDNSSK